MKEYFFLKINGKSTKIFFKELQYVEALDKCVRFVTEKKNYMVLGCLYQVEGCLPADDFCRIHRSYIVSLRQIEEFSSDIVSIANVELPIGRQYRSNFLDRTGAQTVETTTNSKEPIKRM
jgi:DNA-binding LytR/AlgR family response regulator